MSELRLNGGNGAAIPPRPRVAETKHDRFMRLAPGRVQRALDALRLVGRLSSTENEYSEREASQIVNALQLHLNEVERKLARKKEQKTTFEFE
ncbi:MAG TPA: hypothetical protein VEW06_06270 [Xanthobacteraceae bacterium]|nr:hypothetical protein [Xanthobacteraceae bacterium]